MCITRLWLVVCHAVWVPSVSLGIHNDCLFDAMCIYAYPNYSPRIVHITFKLASLCTVAVHLTQCVLCMFMPMMFLLGVRYCLYPCHSMSRYTKTFPLCLMYIYVYIYDMCVLNCFRIIQSFTTWFCIYHLKHTARSDHCFQYYAWIKNVFAGNLFRFYLPKIRLLKK